MKITPIFIVALAAGILFSCKPAPKGNTNIEFEDTPKAAHLVFPGLGWIGVIENDSVSLQLFSGEKGWVPDNVAPFGIPQPNQGILGMGLGSIGVINNDTMQIYIQEMGGSWERAPAYFFVLPEGYRRVFTLKQEWELAVVGIEFAKGRLEFFYFDHYSGAWTQDETASFNLPSGIDAYFSLGNMTLAITDRNSLGVYVLHEEGSWHFASEHVLDLPENMGVVPFEPGIIGVIKKIAETYQMHFYQLDVQTNRWVTDQTMTYTISVSE